AIALMAQKKASQVDGFIAKPDKNIHFVLLYGPDQGLVSERSEKLSNSLGFGNNDPMSILRFEAEDIASQTGKLSDEAFSISMFGNNKLIKITGNTRKNIVPALKPVLDEPPPDCWIIFEGGDLKRDSALRKLIEKSDSAIALPCYQDGAAALEQLINEEITAYGLSLDYETRDYLRSFLGEDRRASRNELQKLALYAHGQNTITREQIDALLGNVSAVAASDIIDAASLGQTDFLNTRLDQFLQSGGSADMLVRATLKHFQTLHQFRAAMDVKNTSPANLISSARPPVHFSRRDSMIKMLNTWTLRKLGLALKRLDTAFYETRAKPALARSISATTLLAIALQAKSR
ncbi:MAG: DNA polymerase III subunit delta, partial [Rhizobiaceae bacterium]|nr:DNA polymerase III subunit delta [Rhizobiaceae bacterium]